MTRTYQKRRHTLVLLMAFLFLGFTQALQAQTPKFRVIAFYNASFDIAHISFANEANVWFAQQAQIHGFQYESTKNWNNLNTNFLSNYQIVIFLDDRPTGASQKAAFQQYMQNGGGFIGFHVCAFNTNPGEWDWFHNQFLATGAFKTNTWGPTSAVFKVEDKTHYATVGLPDKFTSAVSEWYGWTKDLRTNPDIRILCSIDPSSFPLGTDPNQSWYNGYYPIVWANKKYKMLYANFGHNDIDYAHGNATKSFTFSNPTQNKIIINSLLNMGGVSVPEVEIPGTVQAEAYDGMTGVQLENTTDAGGGQNVGYIDAGDWMDYNVNVKTAGTYTVEYRVASTSATGTIQLRSGSTTLATAAVPNTTGWQNWRTISTTCALAAGKQTLRLQAGIGGYNLNWVKFSSGTPNVVPTVSLTSPANNATFTAPASVTISADAADTDGSIARVEFFNGTTKLGEDLTSPYTFTWVNVGAGTYTITARATDNLGAVTASAAATIQVASPTYDIPGTIQAEAYEAMTGIQLENTTDEGGGRNVGYLDPNDWLDYKVNVLSAGLYKIEYRVASMSATGTIQLKSGANTLATSTIPNTTGWQMWRTISTTTTLTAGPQILRLQVGTGGFNINWVRFSNDFTPNNAPTVSLTAPLSNATYTAPASVSISADAADVDGTISKVEFFNGTTKIGDDASSPYTFTWANVAAGTFNITARATDNLGAATTSSVVIITVKAPLNTAPTVSLTAPANNANYTAPASVSISANAADVDGTISKVEFFNGTTKLGEDLTSPYSFVWANVAAGTYSISARATDNLGASTTSSAVSITVKTNTNVCSGIPTFAENGGYVAGSRVQSGGSIYQCKPYPYSGWCNGAAWAYGPGTGAYWADAWDRVGACNARTGEDDVISVTEINGVNAISILPNPTTQSVLVKLNITTANTAEYSVISPLGVEVSSGKLNANQEAIVDLTGMQSGIYTIRILSEGNAWTNKIIKQ